MTYTTKMIVELISDKIKKTYVELLEYNSFKLWKEKYIKIENHLKFIFPENIHNNFPLHDDVLKLIIKELFNVMPFSKPYILKYYEKVYNEMNYLLFPAQKPKRLIILFSGLSGHKTYNRYSWYWDETEQWDSDTVYLFLNDLEDSWYVGTDEKPKKEIYIKIIQYILNEYNIQKNSTFTIGGSMGGYASILFAFDMGLGGAISIHPQITFESTKKHKVNDWTNNIIQCGSQFYNLTDFIFKRNSIPYIYLEYGDYEADKEGGGVVNKRITKKGSFFVV